MTCGIYTIRFKGTDQVYVGQSGTIELRWKTHIRELINNTSNSPKLQAAYNMYYSPIFEVWEICASAELDKLEIKVIKDLNSFNDGLNSTPGGKGMGQGVNTPRSKYSREQILEAFTMLTDDDIYSIAEISNKTGIVYSTVGSINTGTSHSIWLKEEFPELYAKLAPISILRKLKGIETTGFKNSAGYRGIVYPTIISPDRLTEYTITNVLKFSKEHGMNNGSLGRLLNGRRKSYRGFTIKEK